MAFTLIDRSNTAVVLVKTSISCSHLRLHRAKRWTHPMALQRLSKALCCNSLASQMRLGDARCSVALMISVTVSRSPGHGSRTAGRRGCKARPPSSLAVGCFSSSKSTCPSRLSYSSYSSSVPARWPASLGRRYPTPPDWLLPTRFAYSLPSLIQHRIHWNAKIGASTSTAQSVVPRDVQEHHCLAP